MADSGSIKLTSGADPAAALAKFGARVRAKRAAVLRGAGLELVREIKLTLSTPGRGRIYKIARTTRAGAIRKSARTGATLYRTHQASAPGDPPAPDTGSFRNSIQFWMDQRAEKARVGTNDVRARGLEFGTLGHGGYIAPRPFMRPSLARVHARMGITVARELRTATKG